MNKDSQWVFKSNNISEKQSQSTEVETNSNSSLGMSRSYNTV
jgi:hypothetical protein